MGLEIVFCWSININNMKKCTGMNTNMHSTIFKSGVINIIIFNLKTM